MVTGQSALQQQELIHIVLSTPASNQMLELKQQQVAMQSHGDHCETDSFALTPLSPMELREIQELGETVLVLCPAAPN